MVVGTQRANFCPRTETDLYLKRTQQMGKSLITTSTQRINFGLIVVSLLRVVLEYNFTASIRVEQVIQ